MYTCASPLLRRSTGAIRTVFEKFQQVGSARQVWLWFRNEGLSFPLQTIGIEELRWGAPTYTAIHHILTNPVYAGAYTYGKTRQERYVDESGHLRKRSRKLPRDKWAVLIKEHHEGFIDWNTYEMNLARIKQNIHPRRHQAGGAIREGTALLQGIATCGACGRKLNVPWNPRTALWRERWKPSGRSSSMKWLRLKPNFRGERSNGPFN